MVKELPPFEFGIQRIQDCGFLIEEAIEPKHDNMQVGYGMNFLFDVNESWIQYLLRADFRKKDTNEIFITGTVLTRFSVNNLSQFVDENDKVVFPSGSIETLFGIAFGHLRAIVAKNISGSRFSTIYIPVIDPTPVFHDLLKSKFKMFKNAMDRGDSALINNAADKKASPKKSTKAKV